MWPDRKYPAPPGVFYSAIPGFSLRRGRMKPVGIGKRKSFRNLPVRSENLSKTDSSSGRIKQEYAL